MRPAEITLLAMAAAGLAQAQNASAVFVDSSSPQIIYGSTVALNATAYTSAGAAIANATFTWTSSDSTSITVDSNGKITGLGLGWADITAAISNNVKGVVRIQVVPSAITVTPQNQTVVVGASVSYSASVLDVNGQPINNPPLHWRVYGPNASSNNGASVDSLGNVRTHGFGSYFVEAYISYTIGPPQFIQSFFGNTMLTVTPPPAYSQTKLLDSGAVRQSFQLRPRRGLLSVNDSGEIAYSGSLEGFATAALTWSAGVLTPVVVASTPVADFPGEVLLDIDDPALNNNGEIATRCYMLPYKSALLWGDSSGTPHMILFDGSSGGGVVNLTGFLPTRFSLNDLSVIVFTANYQNTGSTTTVNGLFTADPYGNIALVVPAASNLPGLGTTYTLNRDFGIDNNGDVLFSATSGSSRVLYRMTPDYTISKVIGTGDQIDGGAITSLGNVAVGKNGHFTIPVYNGTTWDLLWYSSDGSTRQKFALPWNPAVYAISGAGEAVLWGDGGQGGGIYRWKGGAAMQLVALVNTPSPLGDLYRQFDSAGITASGEIIIQSRTENSLLVVVKAASPNAPPPNAQGSVLFQTGDTVNAPAGPAFLNLVVNGHTGNAAIATGNYFANIFDFASGVLVPRLVDGDSPAAGLTYEGNQTTIEDPDGNLIFSTDQGIGRFQGSSATMLGHFPQVMQAGNLNTGFQLAASSAGTLALTGGTSFGVQAISLLQKGVATVIAYLGGGGQYKTSSPSGGVFNGSNQIGADENGNVYANLNVTGGAGGLFMYNGSGWTALLKIGDTYDGRAVASINSIRAAGNACFALITLAGGVQHIAQYQNGAWTDFLNSADALPNGGIMNSTYSFSSFDVNRKGALVTIANSNNGVQHVVYTDGVTVREAADADHPTPAGEYLTQFFQVRLNDDGRIFVTGITLDALLVLYEFDPLF
jgi:hypothetical protein